MFSQSALFFPVHAQIGFARNAAGEFMIDGEGRLVQDPASTSLVMSISGAISVGTYQAGVNWALLELFRRATQEPEFATQYKVPNYSLRAVTGASAGNINTLLWAIEACTEPSRGEAGKYLASLPESSLFAQVWTRMGIGDMLLAPETEPFEPALLNLSRVRGVTDPPVIEGLRSSRLVPGCTVPTGITLTRIRPDTLRLRNKLAIETQRFATVFNASVASTPSGNGQRMQFFHPDQELHKDPRFGKLVQLSPWPGDIHESLVLNAVQASSAFPLAFRPVALQVRYPDTQADSIDVFVDGGVFDNNPLSLVLDLYRVTNGNYAARPTDVIYIDPGRLRRPVSATRKSASSPVTPGGLGAVFDMLGGAVSTARQYELQLIAREQQTDSVRRVFSRLIAERDTVARVLRGALSQVNRLQTTFDAYIRSDSALAQAYRAMKATDTLPGGLKPTDINNLPALLPPFELRLTTRGFPLFSEKLHSFAGFLGAPLRRFDFWVGVYDALYLIGDDYTCRDEPMQRRRACRGRAMAELIQDSALFREPGRSVLAALHDREYNEGQDVLRRAVVAGDLDASLSADTVAQQERAVLLSLFRALEHELDRESEIACTPLTPLGHKLCGSGLAPALIAFRNDPDTVIIQGQAYTGFEIVKRWGRQPDCKDVSNVHCRAEPHFIALVENPERETAEITDRLVTRLHRVEQHLDSFGHPKMSHAVLWFYHLGNLAHSPRRQFFTSAIPDSEARNPLRYLPYHLTAQLGASGYELGYRPTIHAGNRFVVGIPMIGHWNPGPKRDPHLDWYGGLGLSLGQRPSLPTSLLVSEWGVGVRRLQSLEPNFLRRGVTEAEIYATVLANSVRLSLRVPHARGWLYGDGAFAFAIGLTDPGGLAYWLTR